MSPTEGRWRQLHNPPAVREHRCAFRSKPNPSTKQNRLLRLEQNRHPAEIIHCSGVVRRELLYRALVTPSTWTPLLRCAIARVLKRTRVVIRRDGVSLEAGTGEGQGGWTVISGEQYEPELVPWLNLLKPGQIVADIGANIGTYSLRASNRVGERGTVVAFEPMPNTLELLRRNCARNGASNIVIVPKAVGAEVGRTTLRTSGHHSSASIVNSAFSIGFDAEITTIDYILPELKLARLDHVKMDIEGAEPLALQGMETTIRSYKPTILFEAGPSVRETINLLSSFSYEIGRYDVGGCWSADLGGGNLFARPH